MAGSINVLHLTDLHFGLDRHATAKAQRANALGPLLALLSGLAPEWKPAIVVISGDIGWKGLRSDYAAAKPFILSLLADLGLPAERLILCAGNHDIDRDAAVGMLPPPSAKEADEWLRIENIPNLARPFTEYSEFCSSIKHTSFNVGDTTSSLFGTRDLLGLRFVILNSAWFCRGDMDRGQLWIGLPQLQVMQSHGQIAIDDGKQPITIGVLHHPPHHLADAESNAYESRPNTYRYLAQRANLLLSGHVHGAVEKATRYYQAAFGVLGGAGYANDRYRNNFSILRIFPDSRTSERRSYEYDPRIEDWIPISPDEFISFSLQAAKTPPPAVVPEVQFTTRHPDEFQLQRAIHAVEAQLPSDPNLKIPLVYDDRIAPLIARLERLYLNYHKEIRLAGGRANASELDFLRNTLGSVAAMLSHLPRQLVLFIDAMHQCPAFRNGGNLKRRACKRLIEFTMTSVLARLASLQLHSDNPIYFADYVGLDTYQRYVSKLDGTPVDRIVRYLIVPADDGEEETIFAPIDWGGREKALLAARDRDDREVHHLPVSFLADFQFPQIAFRLWLSPDKWDFSGTCRSVFIKDDAGEYL